MNTKFSAEKGLKYDKIMGIKVLVTNKSQVLTSVEERISHNSRFNIVTPNPELVLMAQKNKELRNALNSADLPVPDGIGLKLGNSSLNIIKGRELFLSLIELLAGRGGKAFFLGGEGNEAALAASKLKNRYSKLKIETDKGWKLDKNAEPATEIDVKLQKDVIDRINKFAPDFVFVAFGNPKQEIWIHKQSLPLRGKNFTKLNVKGAMAVGGTFRYVAGLSKLPPKWMGRIGLEWLWRLITEPFRFKRIWNAVVIFPLKVFWYKITH